MNTNENIQSILQKDINRLRKVYISLNEAIEKKNMFIKLTNYFIKDMLEQGKISKEDLRKYFKKYEK
jgi:hypothetical protein